MGSDGFVKVIDESSKSAYVNLKKHNLPVTAMNFVCDNYGSASYVLSGSADYSYNIIPCTGSFIGIYCVLICVGEIIKFVLYLIIVAVVLFIASAYFNNWQKLEFVYFSFIDQEKIGV